MFIYIICDYSKRCEERQRPFQTGGKSTNLVYKVGKVCKVYNVEAQSFAPMLY